MQGLEDEQKEVKQYKSENMANDSWLQGLGSDGRPME